MSYLGNSLPATILIVDDAPNNLQLLLKYLKNAGYRILIAQSGKKAIETTRFLKPNLILLDVMMGELDGFATCRQLKSDPITQDIPIIFMTALTESKSKVKGFELGAVDYITKPIDEPELLARIHTHISIQNLHQRLTQDAARQKLLFNVSDRIRRSLNINKILETATTEIRAFFDCDFVGILALKKPNISIKAHACAKDIKIDLEKDLLLNSLCSNNEEFEFYLQGNTKVIESQSEDYFSITTSSPPKSQLIEPILVDNNTLWGWLVIEQHHHSRQWFEEEINLLQELTTQLSIAIQQGVLCQQLSQLALSDSLTKIYNRRYFDRQLEKEWSRLRRIEAPLSLIMCDVDCFKIYNDTYGHQKGDECLQLVAQAIGSALKRPADILARYGGEEFIAILPHTPESGAIKVAESMRNAVKNLNLPHTNSLVDSSVTISIGVSSTVPNGQYSPSFLTKAADLALYQAKEHGRNRVLAYSLPISQVNDIQNLEQAWVKRLRHAISHNLFSLYAQPIAPLNIGDRVNYFEILLRLTDQEDKVITPNIFLDIAERNSMMAEVDTWVIESLLKQLTQKGKRFNWENYRFSVNLSGASLNDESFMEYLIEKLTNCHLPLKIFCFEITETVAIANLTRLADFINQIKHLGCSFALDDFGKGMSSLSYLQNLPVDYLKIDGSFVKQLENKNSSKVMIEAIHHIADGIGCKTVAEFVENQKILEVLKHLKIDYAQGFHLGRPGILMDRINNYQLV